MIEGLENAGDSTLDDLFEALHQHFGSQSRDPRARANPERAQRDEAVLDRVIAGLDSDDETARGASCLVLAEVGPPAAWAVPNLLRLAARMDWPGFVLSKDGRLVYTDYLSLLKFDSGWRIVAKVYHSHGD